MTNGRKWLKSVDCIGFEVVERVAHVTLNRPDKRNALSTQMLQELHDAFLESDDRTDVNVILLSGAGRVFCAGYDLTGSYGGGATPAPEVDPALYRTRAPTLAVALWTLERPPALLSVMVDLNNP